MGLFSAVAGIFGGGAQKKASRRAEKAQLAFLERALGEEARNRELTRADLGGYREAGLEALGGEQDLLGLNGDEAQGSAIERLRASPLYQMLFDNGEEAVLQNASATGGIRGGNTIGGLADFGRDTLAQVIEAQLSKLGGLAGRGQNAAAQTGAFGQQSTSNIASILGNQGAVKAGGILTRGGISAGMWNTAGGALDQIASTIAGFPGLGGGSGGLKF